MTTRLLKKEAAANYLGMSVRLFDDLVRPYVPLRRIRAGQDRWAFRYDVRHLDEWVDNLPIIDPADARGENETCINPKGSNSAKGMLRKASA